MLCRCPVPSGASSSGLARVLVRRRITSDQTGTRTERLVAAVQSTGPRRNDAVRILLPGEFADDPNVGIAVPVGTVISGGRAVVRASIR